MVNISGFEFEKRRPNFTGEIKESSLLQDLVNGFMARFKSAPVGLSNDVSFALGKSFVDKQGSLIIRALKCAKNCFFIEFHF